MIDWKNAVVVMAGGSVGCLCRFLIATWTTQRLGPAFPYGTLFINVTGSFFIGLIAEFAQTRALGITPLVRTLLVVGFCGGYTTFSSFAFETINLGSEALDRALVYVGSTVVAGIAATYAGITAARLIGG